ncbi:MAG: AAA family ATPase [Candidatus Omnitrophota bacterium]
MSAFIAIELSLYAIILLTLATGIIFSRRFRMVFMFNWATYAIGIVVYALVRLAIWGLMSLESFYMKLTLAQLPMQILLVGVNAAIFVYFYSTVLGRGFSKSGKKQSIKGELVNVKWSDVIGMENVKAEAREVVELIRDRTRVKKIGGKLLRGILMLGPPGCGKTYLAKAVATETGLPFLAMSGSEFVEVFVGVGASRVRELFKKARQLSYGNGGCIIFIDELDAIARKRVFSAFGGTEETNSTQNQLLAEMDGLQERESKSGEANHEQNIIVIGATNSPEDNLDKALLRPGRFDRKLYIDLPSLEDREKLFTYYLGKILHDPKIDVGRLARKAVYKSPADIENIVREAALIATREKRDSVTLGDISEAMERVDLGVKHKINMPPREREMTAYHEAGHLITVYMLHPTEDVFKASIIPRRGSLGVVHHQPKEEFHTKDKEKLLAEIKCALGGYVAEKLKFGTTTTGVTADFKHAMNVAHAMVWVVGMGDKGRMGDYTAIPENQLSEKVKEELNDETQRIFQECIKDVEKALSKNMELLDRFAKELMEREELDYDDIDAIFKEYGEYGVPKGV